MRRLPRRELSALVAGLVIASAGVAPTAARAADRPDWLATFAGPSPTCAQPLTGTPAANCRGSGTVSSPYPLGHYAFDWHIRTGVTHPENSIAALLQWLASLVWTVTLTSLELVVAALQWSFSLDLLHRAVAPLTSALGRLHNEALGASWQTVALGLVGLTALYHGIVRQDTAESVVGGSLAIVLVAVGLYLIQRPEATLGPLSALANQAGGGFLAGAVSGDPGHPDQGVADASAAVFDAAVTRPWCAVEFGDVNFCLSRAPGGLTWAQRWLRYAPGSRQRNAEYDALAGDDLPGTGHGPLGICDICVPDHTSDVNRQVAGVHRDPGRVAFQTTGATVVRAAIIVVMCAGLWCGIALIGWLTALIVLQSVLQLALILLAPLMCLAPALGSRGRRMTIRWLALLGFTIAGRAIYAFGLAVVLALTGVLSAVASTLPYGLGFVLVAASWFVAFRRRDALLASLSGGRHRGEELGALLRAGRAAAPRAVGAAGLTARAGRAGATAAGAGALTGVAFAQRRLDRAGVRLSPAELGNALQRRREHRRHDRGERRALEQLTVHDRAAAELPGVERELEATVAERASLSREVEAAPPELREAMAGRTAALDTRRARLAARRDELRSQILDPRRERDLRWLAAERQREGSDPARAGVTSSPAPGRTGAEPSPVALPGPTDASRQDAAGPGAAPPSAVPGRDAATAEWAEALPYGAALPWEEIAKLTPWERWTKRPRPVSDDPSRHRLPPPGEATKALHARAADYQRRRTREEQAADEKRAAANQRRRQRRAQERSELERLSRQEETVKRRSERLAEKAQLLRDREDHLAQREAEVLDGEGPLPNPPQTDG